MEIINDWSDELIMCPSQCFLSIENNQEQFTIYLRWRHCDPWTCQLVPSHNGKLNYDKDWIDVNINDFSHDELEDAKKTAIALTEKYFIELENKQKRINK